MSPEMQIQLLRVLQEGTFERVGESITRYTDVRIIAATNRKLNERLRSGKFREDLYYRLNVIPIVVPPLREHLEDIPFLVKHFLKKYSQLYHKTIEDVSDETLDILLHYSWPGNIRELENAMEYAFVRTQEAHLITREKLPPIIRENLPAYWSGYASNPAKTEAIKILELLERHHWNRTKVAKELGIGRTTLWRKMRQNNMQFPK